MSIPAPASFRRRFAALCYEALLLAAVTCVALFLPPPPIWRCILCRCWPKPPWR